MAEYCPRLLQHYKEKVMPELMKEFSLTNRLAVPRLQKVVLNIGLGEAIQNPKLIETAVTELAMISGQKPVVTRARKSISSFKLREGAAIGVTVTLRRFYMYEFVDRLFSVALPRVRDFRGVSPNAFDGRGNYTLGLREQIIFPEINYDKVDKIKGMSVTFTTTAPNDEQGRALLRGLGMPFRKQRGESN
ncbi:MAG: 50S ribosomal protein L5 [Deltaproteobacteria bacterium]|nr:50S ribosomal protein L5 [Deltaproteobacteria bacterium]